MTLSFSSHPYFSTSTMSTTKKNERITRNRRQIYLYKYVRKDVTLAICQKQDYNRVPTSTCSYKLVWAISCIVSLQARFFISFIDYTTKFRVVRFLKQKNNTSAIFCKYKQLVENQTSRTIKKVRSDNGGEYISQEWEKFFNKNGIIHQKTVPYTP